MPFAQLRFTLPDEQAKFDAAMQGGAARLLLWEIDQHCRSVLKYGEPQPETRVLADAIRQMILNDPGVTLE